MHVGGFLVMREPGAAVNPTDTLASEPMSDSEAAVAPSNSRPTDCEMVLLTLRAAHGQWVENLYHLNVMVHSRVAELRRRGHKIECKRFGASDYRYRIVEGS